MAEEEAKARAAAAAAAKAAAKAAVENSGKHRKTSSYDVFMAAEPMRQSADFFDARNEEVRKQ